MPCYAVGISRRKKDIFFLFTEFFSLTECTEILMLFYYPIAEGDEAEEDVGDESADIAVLEHL